jgi:heptosyltransferase-1
MRVLIIKTSSLGDVLHTLPALTDAARVRPDISFDWVVEEDFAEIPGWHPAVNDVLAIANRRWRRAPLSAVVGGEVGRFIRRLRGRRYDRVIDAQGLAAKSAWVALWARGRTYGMDFASVREPLAALGYRHRLKVPKGQHAVERLRQLFALALGYGVPHGRGDYGLRRSAQFAVEPDPTKLVLLHGTSWPTKEWPLSHWAGLIDLAHDAGFRVHLTWGNPREMDRARSLAAGRPEVVLLGRLGLTAIARELAAAAGVVAVDTGLGHLAAALAVPTLSLYGPTAPALTGAYGLHQRHWVTNLPCAPCLSRRCRHPARANAMPPCLDQVTPAGVWEAVREVMDAAGGVPPGPAPGDRC